MTYKELLEKLEEIKDDEKKMNMDVYIYRDGVAEPVESFDSDMALFVDETDARTTLQGFRDYYQS